MATNSNAPLLMGDPLNQASVALLPQVRGEFGSELIRVLGVVMITETAAFVKQRKYLSLTC